MNSERHWTLTRRIDKVRKEMERRNIDTFLVSKTENKNYLSMFYSSSFDSHHYAGQELSADGFSIYRIGFRAGAAV